MSGVLSGPEDMKSSIDRQARTTLEHHRQAQDRLGSMDRADDGRRGHKTGEGENKTEVGAMKTYLKHTSKGFEEVYVFINLSIGQMEILEDEKSADDQTHSDSVFGSPSSGSWADLICTKC